MMEERWREEIKERRPDPNPFPVRFARAAESNKAEI
jgi:hypothetical protein